MSLPNSATSTDPALIAIQAGKLTYAIGIGNPARRCPEPEGGPKLMQLAAIVLQRGATLGH